LFALPVTFQARTACAYLGTLISTHLENMINKQRFDQCHQVRQLAEQYWTGYRTPSKEAGSTSRISKREEVDLEAVAQKAKSINVAGTESKLDDVSPDDEYCSSCDERDNFDRTVVERLESLDIDVEAVKQKPGRKLSTSHEKPPGKFQRRLDHDSRSAEDWSRTYERFVRSAGPTICKLFGAEYMLFMIQGRSIAIPSPVLIPDPVALSKFSQYLQAVRLKKTVVSSCISKDFHGMKSTRGLSGAIYLPLSDDGGDFAVFCRQEQIVNVTWAVSAMPIICC
jgi:light-regulated signal transduction histidine kinase (bacteriophytochrome)